MTIVNTYAVISFINYWNKVEITDLSKLYPKNNTKIFDENGTLLANLSSIYTEYTPYSSIPDVMIDAIVSIEDSRFFSHNGLDYEAIIRSIVANIKDKSLSQGASTITQQLVKNIYLSNEKTIERKINEAILSLKLEKILNKEDILASYLSNVLFGGKIYGIKMASKYYFNKEIEEIELKEAALLAGLVQLPNYYNPFNNYEAAKKRRDLVLSKMLELGYIDDSLYTKTINTELSTYLNKGEINEQLGIYSSYIDYATTEAITKYKINFYTSDMDIVIPINLEMQNMVYQIMQNKYNTFPDDKLKCAIVVLENKTGKILALCGNREKGMKNLNYATDVYNQPGSTIKPILSYAPAFEYLNYVPLTQILDEPYTYPEGIKVKNWDNKFLGNISLRHALSDSRNIPAIKLYKTLNDKSWMLANKLGLENRDGYIHESQAIGGFEKGFSVLEMTNAYLAFANMGNFIKATSISSIKTSEESIKNTSKIETVMSESTAYLINDILHDVLKNTSYDLKHTFLSTKTGQSNYDYATRVKYNIPQSSTKDSWVISYTPDLTIGIWCGYDNMEGYLTPTTKNIPLKIMKMFLNEFAEENLKYE